MPERKKSHVGDSPGAKSASAAPIGRAAATAAVGSSRGSPGGAAPGAAGLGPVTADEPRSEEEAHALLVASTFANLELQSTKKTLNETLRKYSDVVSENKRLADELKERDRDALQVVEFLRVQLEERNARVVALEHKLESVAQDHDGEMMRERQRHADELAVCEKTLASTQEEVVTLRKELDGVALFKRERQEILLEISRAKERHSEMINKYEKELTKLRFQGLEEKVRLRAAEKEMSDKFNQEVDARAMIMLDAKAQGAYAENKKLAVEKAALQQEIVKLLNTDRATRDALVKTRREAELGVDAQEIYAKHGVAVARSARQANARVRQLEDAMADVIASHRAEVARIRGDFAAEKQQLQDAATEAQKNAKVCHQELARFRKLTRTVVQQRSDLENFFNEALDHVRRQRLAEENAGGAAAYSLPQLRPTPSQPQSARSSRPGTAATAGAEHHQQQQQQQRPGPSARRFVEKLVPGNGSYGRTVHTARGRRRDSRDELMIDEVVRRATNQRALVPTTPFPQEQADARGSTDAPLPNGATGDVARQPPSGSASTACVGDDGPDFGVAPSQIPTSTLGHPESARSDTCDASRRRPASVDFGELCWSDKEKIIRALLFKINQSFYASQPPHTHRGLQEERQQWEQQQALNMKPTKPVDVVEECVPAARSVQQDDSQAGSAAVPRADERHGCAATRDDTLFPSNPSEASATFLTQAGPRADSATASRPSTRGAPMRVVSAGLSGKAEKQAPRLVPPAPRPPPVPGVVKALSSASEPGGKMSSSGASEHAHGLDVE